MITGVGDGERARPTAAWPLCPLQGALGAAPLPAQPSGVELREAEAPEEVGAGHCARTGFPGQGARPVPGSPACARQPSRKICLLLSGQQVPAARVTAGEVRQVTKRPCLGTSDSGGGAGGAGGSLPRRWAPVEGRPEPPEPGRAAGAEGSVWTRGYGARAWNAPPAQAGVCSPEGGPVRKCPAGAGG